jgi:hypothetical protein
LFVARTIGLAVAFTCVVSPALAADPKPDAAIKNRNVDASVLLDDKIKAEGSKIFGGARPKGDDQ